MAWFKLGLAGVVAAFVFCASAAQDGIALADSGQVLLSGTLGGTTPEGTSALSARGYSVAGARVTVYLDPADGGHMAVGETADDVQVASAVTDPMGRYSLVTDPSGPAAAAAAAHGGYVNLVETVVTADNQMLITNFTAELVDGGWRTGDAATDPQPAPDAALVHAPAYR